jgi:hypothetical protein
MVLELLHAVLLEVAVLCTDENASRLVVDYLQVVARGVFGCWNMLQNQMGHITVVAANCSF